MVSRRIFSVFLIGYFFIIASGFANLEKLKKEVANREKADFKRVYQLLTSIKKEIPYETMDKALLVKNKKEPKETILHWGARNIEQKRYFKDLLRKQKYKNYFITLKDTNSNTPLHYVFQHNTLEVILFLLSKFSNNQIKILKNKEQQTPFDVVAKNKKLGKKIGKDIKKFLEILLLYSALLKNLEKVTPNNLSIIYKGLNYFIEKKIAIPQIIKDKLTASINENKETPVHKILSLSKRSKHAQLLYSIFGEQLATLKDQTGLTPLHRSALNTEDPFGFNFLAKKFDLSKYPNKDDFTPLHFAARRPDLKLVKSLAQEYPESFYKSKASNDSTPLYEAKQNSKKKIQQWARQWQAPQPKQTDIQPLADSLEALKPKITVLSDQLTNLVKAG